MQEREKLQREIAAREKAEKLQAEYEERFRSMQHEMERRQGELTTAQGTIRKLEEQLKETQVAKDELVAQQQELHEMMIRLEESKNLEAEERARLEEEINSKRSEVTGLCALLVLLALLVLHDHVLLSLLVLLVLAHIGVLTADASVLIACLPGGRHPDGGSEEGGGEQAAAGGDGRGQDEAGGGEPGPHRGQHHSQPPSP